MALGVDMPVAPRDTSLKGKVVILNGYSGTGKTTILNNIKSQRADQKTQIVDSDVMTRPMHTDRGLYHYQLQRQLRAVYLQEVRKLAGLGCTVLMSACLVNNAGDRQVLDDVLAILRGSSIPLLWINLHCGQGTLEQRAPSPGRFQDTRYEVTDPNVLRSMTNQHQITCPSSARHNLDGINLVTARLDVGRGIEDAVDMVSGVMDRERRRL
ncbi:hypothetical protein NW762_014826 [Fusarium torreyae]|uniref:CobW/HypB/UreG nucleotide-binding domain-containing protein n=1 Tax=Fusarium torreyae TaxID=1237075 RepID=A0A9W8RKW9_9HYPO|nr:hypothetical protein NW762_014826 [Fusarium torreyae]